MRERREFLVILFGRGLQGVTLIATIRLLTSLLSTGEVGRYYVLLSLVEFFALSLISPIGYYLNRKTFDWYRNGTLFKNLDLVWLYIFSVSVLAFIALLLIRSLAGIGVNVTLFWLIVVVIGSLLFNSANLIVTTLINILGNRFWFVAFTILTLWVGLGLSVLFVVKTGAQAEHWLAGIVISQFVVFLLAYWYLKKSLSYSGHGPMLGLPDIPKKNALLSPISFAWPLAVTSCLGWIQTQSYRFVLGHWGGLGSLGLFAVGFGIATVIMAAFYDVFSLYYYPMFYKQISGANSDAKRLAWNRAAAYLFPASILVFAFIVACAPYLAKLLVSANFLGADRFIIWGALAQLAFVLGAGFQMLAHAEMKTTWLISPGITGAVVAVVGVFGLAHWNPQLGSGIALTLAGFATATHLAVRLHRKVAFSIPWRRVFISVALSLPLLLVLLIFINPLIERPTYFQSIAVLLIAGGYLLVVQYLMATRWLTTGSNKGKPS